MGMVLIMAFLDIIGVASILPFMTVLVSPELIQTNTLLQTAYSYSRYIGIQTVEEFLFALGVLVFALLVFSLTFKAFTSFTQSRFVMMFEYSIGKRLVESYLHQPYSWFLNRHSADLGKTILSEVSVVINKVIFPLVTLIAQSVVTFALLILLISVDPFLAISAGVLLGGGYAGIFVIMSSRLKRLGHSRAKANQERFMLVTEAFGAAKVVKVSGAEHVYIQRFANPAKVYAQSLASSQVIALVPRYVLEAIAFGGMLLVILYLMDRNGSLNAALPVIALYAFAGYRLMPSLQQIFNALTQLRFAVSALPPLFDDLSRFQAPYTQNDCFNSISFTQAITLNQVSYRYPNNLKLTLKDVNVTIPFQSVTGFVGTTGSGKTTTVDLILGLLEACEGNLSVDGKIITDANRRQWQSLIGYVPQHIYLADDSVAANIAFGVNTQDIDQVAVEHAANIANLHEFITNLPEGYETAVGERGVRLSGGQRQRIGIARALYHNPQVLILDEATSALDNLTEESVMNAVNNLKQKITIIVVAHRLSTVRECDQIYLLNQGEVEASGTFEELITVSQHFSDMVNKA